MTAVLNALGKPSPIDAGTALARAYAARDGRPWFVVLRKHGRGRKAVTLEAARPSNDENIIRLIAIEDITGRGKCLNEGKR